MLKEQNFTLATNAKRIFAFGIDEFLISFLFILIYSGDIMSANSQFQATEIISNFIIQYFIIKTIYQTFFIYKFGATLGKYFCKIRCVTSDFQNPNFSASFIRAVVRIISENILYLGFAWAFGNNLKQTWHDKVAKTLVVNVD